MEGRPKALVNWTLNGNSVDMIPYASVNETKQGRSLLTLDISNDAEKTTFSTTTNNIRCFASNAGGSTEGNIQIIGSCEFCVVLSQHITYVQYYSRMQCNMFLCFFILFLPKLWLRANLLCK